MTRPRQGKIDGEILWTFSLSFAAHAVLMFLFLAGPNRYLRAAQPPIEAYTVELIAPGVLGGESGPGGEAGLGLDTEVEEPEPVVELEEPEPVVEVEEPEPVAEVEEPEPVAEVEEPEPVAEVEEPEPVAEVEEPEPVVEVEEPEPVVEVEEPEPVAEVEEPEPVAEVEEPEPVAEVEEPEPVAEVEEPEPEPVAKLAESKAEPPPKPTSPRRVATEKPRKQAAPAKPTRTAPARVDPAGERDRRIAAAIERRAATARPPSTDDRIAAAVQRRAAQLGSGGGGAGGPLSSGPGTGVGGGTIIGAEYLLYKRRMEWRIRDAWIWAGADDALESVVHFRVSPEGQVGNVRTTQSSGDKAYDASAERAVEAASPLGMVPQAYRAEFADVEMTFRAQDLKR